MVIPATLHQSPQLLREGWVCRSWGALALRYGEHGHGGRAIIERNSASEYLCGRETTVNWSSLYTVDNPGRTSIMTIAKEKMSASLLHVPSFKTSGAVHRAL